jgi:D-alanyl-D-alanine carboxypeptidase/D-alanyl-D-alanine-endopeptidase (penicillin-binding protein 4)
MHPAPRAAVMPILAQVLRGPSATIVALCAALLLASSASVGATTGGSSAPTGPSGVSGASGSTGPSGTTGPPTLAKLDKTMASAMKSLGKNSGAYVYDLDTGQVLFDDDATIPRNPASVEKLYTLSAALSLFGSGGTLHTDVYGVGTLAPGGVWEGSLYLRGGGDPTFGDKPFIVRNYGVGTTAGTLAHELIAATHLTRVDGSIIGDESYFDSLRGGPASNYQPDPELFGEISALSFDRGAVGKQGTPPLHAAHELALALAKSGVVVTGHSRAGTLPASGARLLASVPSPPMSTLAALTATPSDNFFAETILKDLGARFGGGGTTPGGAAVVLAFLAKLGIVPQIVDGSGLSRSDLTTPLQVVTLLQDLSPGGVASLAPVGDALRAALPVDGETGTLVGRMTGTPAAGNCIAKTGTLSDASDLAGWCDGRFAFALLMNGVEVWKAQEAQDKMIEALAAYGEPAATGANHSKSAKKPASSSTATPSR